VRAMTKIDKARSERSHVGVHLDSRQRMLKWAVLNQRGIYFAFGALLAIVGLVWGLETHSSYREEKAVIAYSELPEEEAGRVEALVTFVELYTATHVGDRARFQLGRLYYEQREWQKSADQYQHLVGIRRLKPMLRIFAQMNLAVVLEAEEKWQDALELYQEVAVDPDNLIQADAYYHMGRMYQRLGQDDEARIWFQKAEDSGAGQEIADLAQERSLWLAINSGK
jgi:tetratricopeptide (TPR) repeat protein